VTDDVVGDAPQYCHNFAWFELSKRQTQQGGRSLFYFLQRLRMKFEIALKGKNNAADEHRGAHQQR
jgi:hypothetical protein